MKRSFNTLRNRAIPVLFLLISAGLVAGAANRQAGGKVSQRVIPGVFDVASEVGLTDSIVYGGVEFK